MRILIQRVFQAWVRVGGQQISRIKQGVLVLVGLTHSDTPQVVEHMVNKTINMRLWQKDGKSWNGSVMDIKGQIMAVSQFTLYGQMKGNKPDFHSAMEAEKAREMFQMFVEMLKKKYDKNKVQTGKFQHLMEVGSVNNGPVTIEYEKNGEENDKQGKQKKQIKEKKEKTKVQKQLENLEINDVKDKKFLKI